MRFISILVLIFVVSALELQAQPLLLTGFVDQDFAGATYINDQSGLDTLTTLPMALPTSGWDMQGLALHYDAQGDRLYVGVDTYGICGDADGSGHPGQTSLLLYQMGGIDRPDLSGGESVVVCFDFNDDGQADIVAGVPRGQSALDFCVTKALPGVALSQSALSFGQLLPIHNGGILGSPVSTCPDMEFSLTNFCIMLNEYATPGQTHIGIHVFMGSTDDVMIGDDYISGPTPDDFLRVSIGDFAGGLPIVNNYRHVGIEQIGNFWATTGEYTVEQGFRACLIISQYDNPAGTYLAPPYDMTILVGNGTVESVFTAEFGAPEVFAPCETFQRTFYAPLGVENMTWYVQMFQFRVNFDPNAAYNYLASNRLVYGPSLYPLQD